MKKTYLIKYVFLLFFVISSVAAFAQTGAISGKVLDETSQPLPGATVTVKGTQKSTATDANGNFRLTNVSAGTVTLQFSFVGYQVLEKTVTVSGNVTVSASLIPTAKDLNEVVVIGYGTERKKDLTGSVATVTAKDFDQGAITTPEQLIQGKVAGVNITSNSGSPGAGSTITIRGGASLNGGTDPLIVLDGVPLAYDGIAGTANPLDLINPNDIESFSILKDASASAIYGNRASNGVIIITTKKGQSGSPVITFSAQGSANTLPKEQSVLSASQFRHYVDQNGTAAQIAELGTANTDWQKEIYQTGYNTDDNLSISGTAGKSLPYRISVGYTDQNGLVKTTGLQRYSTGINLSPSLLDNHLKINFNFLGSEVDQRFVNEGAVIGDAVTFDPTQPVKSTASAYAPYGGYWQYTDPNNAPSYLKALAPLNPVSLIDQNNNRSTVYRAITSLNVDYKMHFFPDLHATVNVAFDGSTGSGYDRVPTDAAADYEVSDNGYHSGYDSRYKSQIENRLFEGYFSYSHDFKSIKSHVDAVAGYSIQDIVNSSITNFYFNNGLYYTAKYGDGALVSGSADDYPYYNNEYIQTSFYGRFNYNYDEKYYLTGSIRSDESTKFAPATRTGTFPSLAAAWRISNEDFLKGNTTISNLKLRLEYGVTGNSELVGDYDYLASYSPSTSTAQYPFGGVYYPLQRPGAYFPGRTWETSHMTNAALDFGFLNDRLTGSLDYYYNKTDHLLVTITQAAGTNFSNQIVGNVGNMENNGLELSLNGNIINTKDIGWTANFNVSFNHNKILNLTQENNPNYPGYAVGGISGATGSDIEINQPGYPRNTFYVYQQVYGTNGKPLDGVFVDRNGDGTVNTSDLYHDHSPDPKQIFGFSSDFRYGKWSVGFVARAELGNYAYNNFESNTGTERHIINPIGILSNGSTDVLTNGLTGNGSLDLFSDYYIQNASFLRMDNAHIGYNVGTLFGGKANLKITANVQNVFIITDYKGIDPEFTYTSSSGGGIDNNSYPRPRTYVLGLNLSLK